MGFANLSSFVQKNQESGRHFFDKDAQQWFESIIYPQLYGGRYFVTSEQWVGSEAISPRKWTVRRANDDGGVDDIGPFNRLDRDVAVMLAKKCVQQSEEAALAWLYSEYPAIDNPLPIYLFTSECGAILLAGRR